MPETPVTYADVEVVDADGTGFLCQIGSERWFVGKYVPLPGTTITRPGDRGRLVLPRWFVEQQHLPARDTLTDEQVEEWYARARLRAIAADEYLKAHPDDTDAQTALDRATDELAAAMVLRARRQGQPKAR